MSSLRDLGRSDEAAGGETQTGEPGQDGSWMEMPGHRWLKIDVEKPEAESDAVPVHIAAASEPSAEAAEAEEPMVEADCGTASRAENGAMNESETIHDLLELGAVEYVEETQPQR